MQKEELEVWKNIPGYEDLYQVSNFGRVKSLERVVKCGKGIKMLKERILKCGKSTSGYLFVFLYNNGKGKKFDIHRLVAIIFLKNPYNLRCVNHKDENKENNTVENLEWCTHEYNNNYGTKPERMSKIMTGKISPRRKCILQYSKEGVFIKEWESIGKASKELNIHDGDICKCCQRKLKSAGKYVWEYKI